MKKRQLQKEAPLATHNPNYPFQILSIDILGPYNESKKGRKFIICVEDVFTKWVEAEAYAKVNSKTVINFLRKSIFSRYGCPQTIISDNGPQFNCGTYRQFCGKLKINVFFTPIYHQQSNPVERRNQELKKILRTLLLGKDDNQWDTYLDEALRIMRTRKNQATGVTPARALFGYELAEAGDWTIPMFQNNQNEISKLSAQQRITQIQTNQNKYQNKYKGNPDDQTVNFEIGDNVMVREMRNLKAPFGPVWSGPCEIIRKESNLVYVVLRDGRPVTMHINDLRPAPPGNEAPTYLSDSDSEPPDRLSGKDLSDISLNRYNNHLAQSADVLELDTNESSSSTSSIITSNSSINSPPYHSSDEEDSTNSPIKSNFTNISESNNSRNSLTPNPTSSIDTIQPKVLKTYKKNPIKLRLRKTIKPKICTLPSCNCMKGC